MTSASSLVARLASAFPDERLTILDDLVALANQSNSEAKILVELNLVPIVQTIMEQANPQVWHETVDPQSAHPEHWLAFDICTNLTKWPCAFSAICANSFILEFFQNHCDDNSYFGFESTEAIANLKVNGSGLHLKQPQRNVRKIIDIFGDILNNSEGSSVFFGMKFGLYGRVLAIRGLSKFPGLWNELRNAIPLLLSLLKTYTRSDITQHAVLALKELGKDADNFLILRCSSDDLKIRILSKFPLLQDELQQPKNVKIATVFVVDPSGELGNFEFSVSVDAPVSLFVQQVEQRQFNVQKFVVQGKSVKIWNCRLGACVDLTVPAVFYYDDVRQALVHTVMFPKSLQVKSPYSSSSNGLKDLTSHLQESSVGLVTAQSPARSSTLHPSSSSTSTMQEEVNRVTTPDLNNPVLISCSTPLATEIPLNCYWMIKRGNFHEKRLHSTTIGDLLKQIGGHFIVIHKDKIIHKLDKSMTLADAGIQPEATIIIVPEQGSLLGRKPKAGLPAELWKLSKRRMLRENFNQLLHQEEMLNAGLQQVYILCKHNMEKLDEELTEALNAQIKAGTALYHALRKGPPVNDENYDDEDADESRADEFRGKKRSTQGRRSSAAQFRFDQPVPPQNEQRPLVAPAAGGGVADDVPGVAANVNGAAVNVGERRGIRREALLVIDVGLIFKLAILIALLGHGAAKRDFYVLIFMATLYYFYATIGFNNPLAPYLPRNFLGHIPQPDLAARPRGDGPYEYIKWIVVTFVLSVWPEWHVQAPPPAAAVAAAAAEAGGGGAPPAVEQRQQPEEDRGNAN